jgi:hypothetical protein
MPDLDFAAMREQEAEERQRDLLHYNEAILRGDAATFRRLREKLGFSLDEAEGRKRSLEDLARAEKEASSFDIPALEVELQAKVDAHRAAQAATEAARSAEDAKFTEFMVAQRKLSEANAAKRRLVGLRRKHAELLGIAKPAPKSEPSRPTMPQGVPLGIGQPPEDRPPYIRTQSPKTMPDGSIIYGGPDDAPAPAVATSPAGDVGEDSEDGGDDRLWDEEIAARGPKMKVTG